MATAALYYLPKIYQVSVQIYDRQWFFWALCGDLSNYIVGTLTSQSEQRGQDSKPAWVSREKHVTLLQAKAYHAGRKWVCMVFIIRQKAVSRGEFCPSDQLNHLYRNVCGVLVMRLEAMLISKGQREISCHWYQWDENGKPDG